MKHKHIFLLLGVAGALYWFSKQGAAVANNPQAGESFGPAWGANTNGRHFTMSTQIG